MPRKTYLSILLLVPFTLTGYSLEAKEYPCIKIEKKVDCLKSLKNSPDCNCPAKVYSSGWKSKPEIVEIGKKVPSNGCSFDNFTFPTEEGYPLCDAKDEDQ